MSHDECDRILTLENNQRYDRSRMGEICVKLTRLESTQHEIMNLLLKIKWFGTGTLMVIAADQIGFIAVIKQLFI